MSLDLHPLSVTLIDRDMPLAAIQVPASFPSPAADDLEDTVDPFKGVVKPLLEHLRAPHGLRAM